MIKALNERDAIDTLRIFIEKALNHSLSKFNRYLSNESLKEIG